MLLDSFQLQILLHKSVHRLYDINQSIKNAPELKMIKILRPTGCNRNASENICSEIVKRRPSFKKLGTFLAYEEISSRAFARHSIAKFDPTS